MSSITGIPWAEATLNTHYGCTKVSPACKNCYAESMTRRLVANPQTSHLVQDVMAAGRWTGVVNVFPERMEQALHWKKPRMIFVNSMSDTFHEQISDGALDKIFAYMALAPQHTFLLLTKRARRMKEYLTSRITVQEWQDALSSAAADMHLSDEAQCQIASAIGNHLVDEMNVGWPMRNVWCGVTIEDQKNADDRVPFLLGTPAMKRFVSIEPMLEEIDLRASYQEEYHYCSKCGWQGTETDNNCSMCNDGEFIGFQDDGRCNNGHDGFRVECCPKCGSDGSIYAFDSVKEDDFLPLVGLDWVICGTESLGNKAGRAPDLDAVRDLRDQCVDADVPFFLKQLPDGKGGLVKEPGLDGKQWLQYPER
ncbi:DUF5131 family protein [Halodesulfovibrio sp.]|uniref:DUF5131 family protein n=1 Tax=Halodesulfovibrio sp. TaxID=1912772 RepID=UPI0025BDDC1C|nr:DUF5131 family protein [Halodesulfovibrio sp.]